MAILRLMDLDVMIEKGMKARKHEIKVDSGVVDIRALQYVIERICCYKMQYGTIVIFAQKLNGDCGDDIVCARDSLARLNYELACEKLSNMGLNVRLFDTREELESEAFKLCYWGLNGFIPGTEEVVDGVVTGTKPFTAIRAHIRSDKLLTCITGNFSASIDNDCCYNLETYDYCSKELEVPIGTYPLVYLLKKNNVDNSIIEYGIDKLASEYKNLCDRTVPKFIGNLICKLADEGKISEEVACNVVKELIEYQEIASRPIDYSQYDKFNMLGAQSLLTAYRMDTALSVLKLQPLQFDKKIGMLWDSLKAKLEVYASGEYSLSESLGKTEYFSEVSESIKTSSGEILEIGSLSETELLNEFL